MFRTWREARNEEGFTLIELLVVVIIIGILAAIAIPAFLNQRERAWQSELTSAVRNASLDIEAEATILGGAYPTTTVGEATARDWINANVNGEAAGTAISATTAPISRLVYVAYDAAGTAVVAPANGTGFRLCMEHATINGAHSVSYFGGSEGTGVQGFAQTACP